MENGVEGIDGFQLEEGNRVVYGSSVNKIEESVTVGLHESSKELEEEVFEEAFSDLQDDRSREELGDETEPVAAVGDSGSVLVVADEEIGVRNKGEAFEEAIDVHAEVGIAEEVDEMFGEKVEGLLGRKSMDEIDRGGATVKVEMAELNAVKEVVEIDADEGPDVLKDGENIVSNREFDVSEEAIIEDRDEEKVKGDRWGIANQVTGELADVLPDLLEDKYKNLNGSMAEFDGECQDRSLEPKADGGVFDSQSGVRRSEDVRDNCTTVDVEQEAFSNGKVEDVLNVTGLELHKESNEIEDDLDRSAGELNVKLDFPSSEKSGIEIAEDVKPDMLSSEKSGIDIAQAPAANLDSEQQKPADSSVNGAEKNDSILDKPKMQVEEHQEDKKSTIASGERGMQVTSKAATSSQTSVSAPPSAQPAGLGRAAPLLEPAQRVAQQTRINGNVSHTQSQQIEDSNGEAEDYDETREKLQMIRVKFLRLAHRLGQTPHNVVVAQVLYRLGLAEQLRGRNGGRVGAFSFDRASAMAEQLEAAGQEALDFSCTIMVLGKTGVGKSATINSIFDEMKFNTDAFELGTKKVQDVVGTVQGIKVRVIDTPGLLPSWSDQHQNEKILHSVKHFIKKTPPDIVLYLDRLDMQSRDFSDMPLLRTISEIFGPSIWFNAIVVLTHAASAPPDGPNGSVSSYDMFVTQRSHVVQQAIRQAAGDMRLMNPVSLVENHSACRTNRAGQRVLPNGQVWKPHLLLLSFASKILAEANTLLKFQDGPPGKAFAPRSRAPPLPFLLSSLLQSRPQVKLPEEQFGDEDGLEDDLNDDSDSEDESECDELPPFKSLTKAQVAKLTKAQKKAYFEELEYREKLLMKKQLRDERRRRRLIKKMAAAAKGMPGESSENVEEESGGGATSVPVPMPDLALPASFDSDNPTHRYRCLDTSNQWLVRPVLETHGWDHDVGYEGINVERLFVVKDKVPVSLSGQVTKDKKDASVQMEIASSIKHGEGKATSLGFDMQTVGKDLAYTLRSETRFSNFRKNKATAGLSVTLLGDAVSAGVKVEDKLIANKRFQMVISGGAMTGHGDVAYGGSLEAQLRDKDYPLGRSLSTLGLSVMDWHGDLVVGCNIQSQIPVGRSTNLIARANLNNRGAGQISVRVNSSEQLQLALVGLFPLLKKLIFYSQQIHYGQ